MSDTCLDTHLNSALSHTILREALADLISNNEPRTIQVSNLKTTIYQTLIHLRITPSLELIEDPQKYLHLIQNWASHTEPNDASLIQFTEFWGSIWQYLPYTLSLLNNGKTVQDYLELKVQLENDENFTELTHFYHLRCVFEEGVCLTARPDIPPKEEVDFFKYWTNSLDKVGVSHGFSTKISHAEQSYTSLFLNKEMLVLNIDHVLLTTRQHFLMFADIISQRFLILFACLLSKYLDRTNYPTRDECTLTFALGDTLLKRYGNLAYNTLTLWEPLIIGHVLSKMEDSATDNSSFLKKMSEAWIDSQGELERENMREFFNKFVSTWIPLVPITSIFQLFGLYRIWGHPTINEIEGVEKLISVACKPRPHNRFLIEVMLFKWREYFAMSYFSKNQKWPQLSVSPLAPDTVLIRGLKEGIEVSPFSSGYDLTNWRYVKFEKTFEVPEKFELAEMIADKATSLNEEELIKECKKTGGIGASYKRSVILQWLNTNYNNPLEFLQQINDKGFDKREKCVGVHPKERELKIFARLFGLLTIEKRLYVVLTEALLADFIFEFFPEITMTFDAVTLNHRIYANTVIMNEDNSKKKKRKKHTVVTNMDFNKWNSYMRYEETEELFRDFDHLFGFDNLFLRTHSMFQESTMYLADGTISPIDRQGAWIKRPGVWQNHLGGIEGLRQKGWTIFTVVLLKYISELQKVKCQIMGQGDNQVLIIDYPLVEGSSVKDRHDDFIQYLNKVLESIGPPLKMEETWSSSHFFIYGKFPVWKGRPMSMSLKKICRTMRLTNEGFQNLESTLSSITANVSAATSSDYDPIIPYIIGSFETIGAISLHLKTPFFKNAPYLMSKTSHIRLPINGKSELFQLRLDNYTINIINKSHPNVLTSMSLFPCVLGGYPTVQIWDLMNHGFPDPLSLNLWGLKELCQRLPEDMIWLKRTIVNACNPIFNPDLNYELLAQDPVSLNLLHGSSGGEKIKRMVFEFLASDLAVANQQFVTFIKLAQTRQRTLVDTLSTMNPLNPRIMNSSINSTIIGRAIRIISKVNKTSTLIGLTIRSKSKGNGSEISQFEDPDIDKFIRSSNKKKGLNYLFGIWEENYIKNCFMLLFSTNPRNGENILEINSATEYAQTLRCNSWKKNITGVTVAVPQEFLVWEESNGLDCNQSQHFNPDLGFIRITTDLDQGKFLRPGTLIQEMTVGPYKPFFGSETKNKVKYEGGALKKVSPPILTGALDMLCLIGWGTELDSNLAKLLKGVFSSFTDLDPNKCLPESSMITGSVEHRWTDQRTSHSSTLSILYEFSTHISILTNYFRPHNLFPELGTDNFNFSFQTIFTWISCIWSSKMVNSPLDVKRCYHLHVCNKHSIKPVFEGMLEIDDPQDFLDELENNKQENNPYCWIPKERLIGSLLEKSDGLLPMKTQDLDADKMQILLHKSLISNYLESYPLRMEDYHEMKFIKEKESILPIGNVFQASLYDFLKLLISFMSIQFLFVRASNLINRPLLTNSAILSEIVGSLQELPSFWYKGLLPFLLNYTTLIELQQKIPNLELPKGTPPSQNAKLNFFKKITNHMLVKLSIKEVLILPETRSSIYYYSNHLSFNPLIMRLCHRVLHKPSTSLTLNLKALALCRKFFCSEKNVVGFNANTDFYKLMILSSEEIDSEVLSLIKNLSYELKSENCSMFMGSSDYLAKVISKRKMICDLDCPLADFIQPTKISLGNLLPAASELNTIKKVSLSESSYETLPLDLSLESAVNYWNHWLKTQNPITTASYKLLSVLNFKKSEIENLNIQDNDVISVMGDGVGGYTVLCGRVFPNVKLLYNSYYEFDKISSVGVDRFIPAAIGMFPSIFERVVGLGYNIEGISDLTDLKLLEQYDLDDYNMRLLISDAEGGGWENPEKGLNMANTLVQLGFKFKTEMIIMKTYASRIDLLYTQQLIFLQGYQKVTVVRSHFSTIGNHEVFLVAEDVSPQFSHVEIKLKTCPNDITIFYSRNFSVSSSFKNLSSTINLNSPLFLKSASLVSENYDNSLRLPKWCESVIANSIDYLVTMSKDGILRFPLDLIYSWRRNFNLIKFHKSRKSNLKLNLLDGKVVKRVCRDYFLVLSLLISKTCREDFNNWMTIIENSYIHFYSSVDQSWSCVLSDSDKKIGYNSKAFKVSDVLKEGVLKELIITCSQISGMSLPFEFLSIVVDLKQPYVSFASETPMWWKKIGTLLYPIGLHPVPYGVYDDLTKTWKPAPLILSYNCTKRNSEGKEAQTVLKTVLEKENLDWSTLFKEKTIRIMVENKEFIPNTKRIEKVTRESLTIKKLIHESLKMFEEELI